MHIFSERGETLGGRTRTQLSVFLSPSLVTPSTLKFQHLCFFLGIITNRLGRVGRGVRVVVAERPITAAAVAIPKISGDAVLLSPLSESCEIRGDANHSRGWVSCWRWVVSVVNPPF